MRTARFLHQNSFQFIPEFKLFINTNHLPKISDDTVFSSDRVKVIPFTRFFEEHERDRGLKAFFRRPENLSGILNWLLEGLRLLNAEGLTVPKPVEQAVDEYREDSDILGLFIKERLTAREGGKIKTKDVYASYEGWCSLNGNTPLNSLNLLAELRKRNLVKRDRDLGNIVYGYCLTPKWPENRQPWD